MYNLVSAATEIDAQDRANLQPAHNHIEAVYNDGGKPANSSAAVALLPEDEPAIAPAAPCHPGYARLSGRDRRFIKGQRYNLLSRHENLTWRAGAR
jgi:hypothetical protein